MNSKTTNPNTVNPEIIDPKISACKKLLKLTDALLRSEIDRHTWFDMLSENLDILRVISKAYAISADLEEADRYPAIIMFTFAYCGNPEMGIRVLRHLDPNVIVLFYSAILDLRPKLCPNAEVYTEMTHDGNLVTRSSDGQLMDLDPICVHASAVSKRPYIPSRYEFEDSDVEYSWV